MHVVIVGAGIIGVSIADALARRGAAVTVLDMRSPGRGASHASAGILAPYTEADERSPLLELGARSLALFDEFVAGAAARSGRSVEYARNGTVQVALSEPDLSHLRASRLWLDQQGIESQWLDSLALRDREPAVTPSALGALVVAQHGMVGVASLMDALLQSARLSGAVFESPVDASTITAHPNGVDVHTTDRRIDADAAVLAGGTWSGRVRVSGLPAVPVRPVRGQLLHVRWPAEARFTRIIWGPDCYVVPWSDGSMLVGATMEEAGFDEQPTIGGVAVLSRAAAALLPAASQAAVTAIRAGLRPASPDGMPIVGACPARPNVWLATGHFRNGILLAPWTAEAVTRALLDGVRDSALDRTRPERFWH